ncbi:MAG: hypothetical protein WAK95_19970 [Desulfobacterales bacterium]
MKCPICQSVSFFVKDPDDEYTTFKFKCGDEDIRFDAEIDAAEIPEVHDDTEAFCDRCAWHGRFDALK